MTGPEIPDIPWRPWDDVENDDDDDECHVHLKHGDKLESTERDD